jgi:iron complex outermembrane receptor protein
LIVVDGMPYSSLLNVDPLDIAKITVIKDAANAALFGMSSQNGVIAIETIKGKNHGLHVSHYSAIEFPNFNPGRALSRDEYLSLGGVDLGSNTNWEKEITQNGIANVTHVSYGAQKGSTEFYVGVNHRNVRGALDNSGFRSYNGNAKITQTLIANKLFISAQGSLTNRANKFSFVEAFRFAKTFLPTSPVRTPNNSGYTDYLTFENSNPEAIVQLNINDGETKISRYNFNVNYKITPAFEFSGGYGSERQENKNRKFWALEDRWRSFQQGMREQIIQNLETSVGFFTANFSKKYDQSQLDISGGITIQNLDLKDEYLRAYGFETNEEAKSEINDLDDFQYGATRFTETFSKNQGSTRYHTSIGWSKQDRVFLNANLSREAYNDNISASAYGLSFGYNLIAEKTGVLTQLTPRVSIGRTANARSFFQTYNPRDLTQSWRSTYNAKITPEKKTELTLGADFVVKKVISSITFFTSTTKNVLGLEREFVGTEFIYTLPGAGKIRNKGIELDVTLPVIEKENIMVSTGLNFSTITNTYLTSKPEVLFTPLEYILYMGGGASQFSLENNKPVGQLHTLTYLGIENGQWKYQDTNGNGGIDYYDDFEGHGRPLPSVYFGWTTAVKVKRIKANILFRSALGHYVFNAMAMGYIEDFQLHSYNAPATLVNSPVLNVYGSRQSNYFLERANYLMLDNLSLEYDLFPRDRFRFNCGVNVAVQNLFTITNYSGVSPEARLDYNGAQYAAGFESQYTYRPARTFLLGLNFKM